MAMCFRCKVNLQDDGEGVAAHPGGLTCEEFQQNVSCSNARLALTVNVSDRRPLLPNRSTATCSSARTAAWRR